MICSMTGAREDEVLLPLLGPENAGGGVPLRNAVELGDPVEPHPLGGGPLYEHRLGVHYQRQAAGHRADRVVRPAQRRGEEL